MNFKKLLPQVIFLLLIFARTPIFSMDLKQFPGVIHIHSNYSSGSYSLSEIIDIARARGIKFLIITDHISFSLSYGLAPFRNILRTSFDKNSLSKKGIKKYLEEIDKLNKDYDDITIIPGIECAPFYYWDGSFLGHDLLLKDWGKHILITGISDDLTLSENVPIISGKLSTRYIRYYIFCFTLFSFAFIISLLLSFSKSIYRFIAIPIGIISFLGALNSHPFKSSKFNPYKGHQGELPYQEVIDYAGENGFLTFWAHPKASVLEDLNKLRDGFLFLKFDVNMASYTGMLSKTFDYTGFEIFDTENPTIILPNNEWDQELNKYLQKERYNPVWTIAGADYHEEGKGRRSKLGNVKTIVLAKDQEQLSILEGLKKGRSYSLSCEKEPYLSLDEYTIKSINNSKAYSGESVTITQHPEMTIKVSSHDNSETNVTIRIIRSGELIKVVECATQCDIEYIENDTIKPIGYYRILVESEHCKIASNPIFYFLSE